MSQNFFAVLDDSGDEAPASKTFKKKEAKKAEPPKPVEKEAPKSDVRRKPNNYDRNAKHGRGGRSAPRDGKRAYERRSGTGRGHEIKKGGGGGRNWGNAKSEARRYEGTKSFEKDSKAITDNDEEVRNDAKAEQDVPAEGAEAEADAEEVQVEKEEEAPPEPEDNTMTYAEYMASKASSTEQGQVQEREVENEFAGKAAAKKVEEDFLVMGGGKSKKSKKKQSEKTTLKANFQVANSDRDQGFQRGGRGRGRGEGRGRGDRGGRGRGRGGRGGRGRGRDYGGRGSSNNGGNATIDFQDAAAFPSL